MSTEVDPFSRIYAAIVTALYTGTEWTALVKLGKFMDVETNTGRLTDIIKANKLPSAFGEVMLDQSLVNLTPFGVNSRVVSGTMNYTMRMATGQLKIPPINKLVWVTFKQLNRAGDALGLSGLVRDWRFVNGTIQQNPTPTQANQTPVNGYAALLTIAVDFDVDRRFVLAPPA